MSQNIFNDHVAENFCNCIIKSKYFSLSCAQKDATCNITSLLKCLISNLMIHT